MATWNTRGLRGSTLEDMVNRTNEKYAEAGLALIQKIPTPITPVKMDKESRQITLAFFEQKSTVDYIGVVQGIPVCFDAKECAVDTFSLQNIHAHQVEFMHQFEKQGGIAFFLIFYSHKDLLYYLPYEMLRFFWDRAQEGGRKSFRFEELNPEYIIPKHQGILVPYLDILKKGLSAQTLARLFALSAEHRAQTEFEKKLAVLTGMVRQGELPFDASECERAVSAWRAAGFPPCHHSETFRQAYAPAYRLMKAEYAPLLPLLCELDGRLAQGRRTTLAIDGPCGSGKTTLAALLAQLYDCPIFHADDFFLRPEQRTPERFAQPGGNLDRERLREEVLLPLHEGKPVCYRRFDCHSLPLQPPVTVAPAMLSIVEGSYCLHPELSPLHDVSVCLSVSPELQRARILARNGREMAQRFFDRWIPLEQAYFDAMKPQERCGFIISSDSISYINEEIRYESASF